MTELETIQQLEQDIFTPALLDAFTRAKAEGHSKSDAIYAAANAYANMLVPTLGGREQAVTFLQQQLRYLQQQH
ncbi:hypothetical protein U5801_24385 [Lamprobacter modestohalophilus]|uniref:hypothetical protein n=1 Tax=Lamprobacter modestohalophilus TaxID=1064514 RepID=UPI002ADEF9F2|nr:hypothetical protein [Lamprobacter modestohalophilus]MEA1052921.1 hypothetical protein [Lamprobacter modestohalophilus]